MQLQLLLVKVNTSMLLFILSHLWDLEEKVLLSLNCHRSRDSADAAPGAGCARSRTQAGSLEMSAQQ